MVQYRCRKEVVLLPKFQDLTGLKFNMLLVVGKSPIKTKRTEWICLCDCGKNTVVETSKLKSGHTKSCGCLQKKTASKIRKTHGDSRTPLYVRWCGIKQRCINEKHSAYKHYGARGISLCDEWLEYQPFKKWALENGYRQDLELDRINNNEGYSPQNCRWVDKPTNSLNKRTSVVVEGQNLIPFVRELANETNKKYSCLINRYYRLKHRGIPTTKENLLNYNNL